MHNAGLGIRATLSSLAAQTFRDFETVIVDDGCTDESVEVARSADPSATIIHQENQGIVGALNTGLAHCRGEFIARIDCHDTAVPERLDLQVAALRADRDLGLVGGHVMLQEKGGRELGVCRFPISNDEALRELLNGRSPVLHTAAMIRKEVMKAAGGYDAFYDGREDVELWTRISLIAKMGNVDQVVMRSLSTTSGLSYDGMYKAPLIELALAERGQREHRGLTWRDEALRAQYACSIAERQTLMRKPRHLRRLRSTFYVKRAAFLHRSGSRLVAIQQFTRAVVEDPTYPRAWLGFFAAMFLPAAVYRRLVRTYKGITGDLRIT
jgi:glycosyltransferase involved in cell wall biosynthesis